MTSRKFWLMARKYATLAILVLFLIIMLFLTNRFLTFQNITNIGRQISFNAIISVGMTIVIISGGIDLSVGSIVALSSCMTASVLTKTNNIFLAIVTALAIGFAVGCFNGILISFTGIAPFIITLSSSSICLGITFVYTQAKPIPIDNETFKYLGQGNIIGIPIPIFIMITVFIVAAFIMHNTKFGRYVYGIGGNEKAVILAGVDAKKYKTIVYIISGILSAVTAIIYTARLSSGVPSIGKGFEMQAITAAVIGGASLAGGQGGVWGTLIGAIIIGILNNALNLLNISSYYQDVTTGLVVLFAVLFDRLVQSRVSSEY